MYRELKDLVGLLNGERCIIEQLVKRMGRDWHLDISPIDKNGVIEVKISREVSRLEEDMPNDEEYASKNIRVIKLNMRYIEGEVKEKREEIIAKKVAMVSQGWENPKVIRNDDPSYIAIVNESNNNTISDDKYARIETMTKETIFLFPEIANISPTPSSS